MQRLMVFLGHPTYALSVVLFTLLLASGLGSFIAHGLMQRYSPPSLRLVFAVLLFLVLLVGLASPPLMTHFEHALTAGRIALAVACCSRSASRWACHFRSGCAAPTELAPSLTPWLWGINGATSVCASVLAVVVALSLGIRASYWLGLACYVVAGCDLRPIREQARYRERLALSGGCANRSTTHFARSDEPRGRTHRVHSRTEGVRTEVVRG